LVQRLRVEPWQLKITSLIIAATQHFQHFLASGSSSQFLLKVTAFEAAVEFGACEATKDIAQLRIHDELLDSDVVGMKL